MCAINGIVDTRGRSKDECVADLALVKKMNTATVHRGPDGSGVWSDTFATLGNNRLAIIDLSHTADQPMQSASGRYVIAFNGEIYNYRELRAALPSYPFKTQGDTEVILALIEAWGIESIGKLRGMFCIALWDTHTHEFFLIRDQSGIKPVYYQYHEGRIAFSSELKGVLADERIERVIDPRALDSYLHLRYVPEPLSMIVGIQKLPPGYYARMRAGTIELVQYFTVPLSLVLLDPPPSIHTRVRELVDAAVAAELVSDRPVGLFLSGGLDSTIVLDAATKAAGKVETYSLRFEVTEEEEQSKFNTDADLAAKTAAHYGANHHEVLFTEEDFMLLLSEATYALDQPIGNATALAQLFLSRKAREHIVVALMGDGGDELFGGYPRYRTSRFMDIYQKLPKGLRSILSLLSSKAQKLNLPPGILRVQQFLFEKDAVLKKVVKDEYISRTPAEEFEKKYLTGRDESDFTQLFMDADRRSWLVDEALARTDTMTMAASLEARVPLLNTDLVVYASTLPSELRVPFWGSKKILRDAFRSRLPAHILKAKKRGFFSPMSKWLRRPQALRMAKEVLSSGYHPGTDALLDFTGVQKMLNDHVYKREYALPALWTLIALRLWAKAYDARLS